MNKRVVSQTPQLIIEILIWICLLILVFGAIATLFYQVDAIVFRYPLDYGEAPLINQAVQLNAGHSIYRDSVDQAPYTIANYPPVYIGLLGLFDGIFGPAFWYGRLISSLSALGSAILITMITYSRCNQWKLALLPGLLFINIPYVAEWSTLARIDHLALFFALLGLFILGRKQPLSRLADRSFFFGSLFLILAIYTRQSYALAAPLAGFLFLFHKNWKQGLSLLVSVAGGSLILFLVINTVTGGGFYFNIVTANINPFSFERMTDNFSRFFNTGPFIFILAALGLSFTFRRIDGWLLPVGFAFGGFLSALTIGKIGSNVNYFLEFAAGLCLLIAFGMIALYSNRRKWPQAAILCAFLCVFSCQGIQLIRRVQNESRTMLDDRQALMKDLEKMEKLVIQNIDRPILADEYMGMLVLNGQDLYLQPFEITQLVHADLFDQQDLIDQIDEEYFSLVLLQQGSWWANVLPERWTPEMLTAIDLNYRLVAQYENTYVYRPKTATIPTTPSVCPTGEWSLPTVAHLGYRFQEGLLVLYGAGAEATVPVYAVDDGAVYRPENFPEGSLLIVHADPLNPGGKVIAYYEDMRSYRGLDTFIADRFPVAAEGILVQQGDRIGYQAMWAGKALQQDWLHVRIGLAPYDPKYLIDHKCLLDNLIDPSDYFGITIDLSTENVRPIECEP